MGLDELGIRLGDPEILGARAIPGGMNFAVEVPDDEEAELVLVGVKGQERNIPLPAKDRIGEISAIRVDGLRPEETGYYYLIGGKKILDPYAGEIVDGLCRCVRQDFDWQGDVSPRIPLHEMTIYKLHVRGFTRKAKSGVKARGTFRGVTEKIGYIKGLGFNTVEFMPIYEWDDSLSVMPPFAKATPAGVSIDKVTSPRNYWGYADHNFYFAPKQKFSYGKDSVREVKEMVRALHGAGLEVVMEFYVPERTSPMEAYQAVRYWKRVYHIDGFRFVGSGVPMEALIRDPMLKSTKLVFDYIDTGWVYGGRVPRHKNLLESNQSFMENARRFLKGDEGQVSDFTEHLRRQPDEIGVVNFMAAVNGFTLADSVSYDWKHNEANGEDNQDGTEFNYTWNCGAEGKSRKKVVIRLRAKQIRNALTYLLMAQGVPMLLAGDENGNSQDGNNNAYSSDNSVGWLDWGSSKADLALTDFVRKMLAFRKAHPILHMEKALKGIDYKNIGYPDISYHDSKAWVSNTDRGARSVGVLYCGLYAKKSDGTPDDFIYAAFNSYWESHVFGLPNLPAGYKWHLVVNTAAEAGQEFTEPSGKNAVADQKLLMAEPRSVLILVGSRTDGETDDE